MQFFNNPHFPIFFPTGGHMCNKDLENLKKWKPNEYLMIERAKVLAPQGVEDMRLLARRLQSSFPHLLQPTNNENITEQDYVVRNKRIMCYEEKKTNDLSISLIRLIYFSLKNQMRLTV